jgi:hypothetical protein
MSGVRIHAPYSYGSVPEGLAGTAELLVLAVVVDLWRQLSVSIRRGMKAAVEL